MGFNPFLGRTRAAFRSGLWTHRRLLVARQHLLICTSGIITVGGSMRIALSVFLFTAAAAWADAASETAIALQHAYAAAQADKIAEVHASLQRVVNCLVGPGDSLFDKHERNPCAKAGKGAIPGTIDAAKKKHLRDAVDMAEMGIANTDLDKAMMLATGTAGAIRASQGSGGSFHNSQNER
jgi:hypothetical protein